jgi:hypothetical protein
MMVNAYSEAMETFAPALRGSYSRELLDSRTAFGDLSTQVKYSDLSMANKVIFSSTLKSLQGVSTQAANEMEELEAKSTATFYMFIERSRMIQRALMQLDGHIELSQNLHDIFEQAMIDADKGMKSLDHHAGIVRKLFVEMNEHLESSYDVYVRERNVQCERVNVFADAWAEWSEPNVERGLLANNLEILKLFGNEYITHIKELDKMKSALGKFRGHVRYLGDKFRMPLLEKGDIGIHIKVVNEAVDALEAKYRKHRTIG